MRLLKLLFWQGSALAEMDAKWYSLLSIKDYNKSFMRPEFDSAVYSKFFHRKKRCPESNLYVISKSLDLRPRYCISLFSGEIPE